MNRLRRGDLLYVGRGFAERARSGGDPCIYWKLGARDSTEVDEEPSLSKDNGGTDGFFPHWEPRGK